MKPGTGKPGVYRLLRIVAPGDDPLNAGPRIGLVVKFPEALPRAEMQDLIWRLAKEARAWERARREKRVPPAEMRRLVRELANEARAWEQIVQERARDA